MTDKEKEAFIAMERACRNFVHKCDTGNARSFESYHQMKDALELVDAIEPRVRMK
jgi:hypothetical protein